MTHVLTDIAPNGDAVIAYVEDTGTIGPVPLQVAVRTKAAGTWATEDLGEVEGLWAVAMSPSADAIVLTADRPRRGRRSTPGTSPAGGDWGAKQEADEVDTTNSLRTAIAFGPDRKAVLGVGVPSLYGVLAPEVQTAVRGAGSVRHVVGPSSRSRRSTTRLAASSPSTPRPTPAAWCWAGSSSQNGALPGRPRSRALQRHELRGAEAL